MANQVCHFEIPADNVAALRDFYGGLFGWTFTRVEGPMEYWLIGTGGQGPEGGMMQRQHPQQGPLNYVMVDSCEAALKRAVELGAVVIMPTTPVPKFGWFAVLMDPQKNPIGLWQDDPNAG